MVSKPHGLKLIDRVAYGERRERLLEEARRELKIIHVSESIAADIQNIAHGVYSPLEGFLVEEDYINVLYNMRLSNDLPWTIPVILDVSREEIQGLKEGDVVALAYRNIILAILEVEQIYGWDKREYCLKVYKTLDPNHPGVYKTMGRKEILVGGKITLLNNLPEPYEKYRLWPKDTRVLFEAKGWRTIAGFQTRNIPHRGHEYIQKATLTFVDGLLIHPLVGWKKPGDFKDDVIIRAYEALIKNYYPKNAVVLSILRMEMRYAGPKEAVFHAIVRKNFGCTHFIVGRDHAGVGSYYGPYEAWELFNEFPDLGITPLFIREAFYCKKCGSIVNEKICPHSETYRIRISGTKLREMLRKGIKPPEYYLRPEVAEVVLSFKDPFIH